MYNRLDARSSNFDYDQIGSDLRQFKRLMRDYSRPPAFNRPYIIQKISKIFHSLQKEFKRPRDRESRIKLRVFEAEFESMCREFLSIPGVEQELQRFKNNPESEDLVNFREFEMKNGANDESVQFIERKKMIEGLHTKMQCVNEIFKDYAELVNELHENPARVRNDDLIEWEGSLNELHKDIKSANVGIKDFTGFRMNPEENPVEVRNVELRERKELIDDMHKDTKNINGMNKEFKTFVAQQKQYIIVPEQNTENVEMKKFSMMFIIAVALIGLVFLIY